MNYKFDTIRGILSATSEDIFKTECDTKIMAFEMLDDNNCLVSVAANNIPFKASFNSNEENVSLTYINMESNETYQFTVERFNSNELENLCLIANENGIIAIGKEQKEANYHLDIVTKRSILASSVSFHSFNKKQKKTNSKQKINI